MNQSNELDKLCSALAKAQARLHGVEKGNENPFFKSSYADLHACLSAARSVLTDHGLSVTQYGVLGQDGKPYLRTMLCHESGQWIAGETPLLYKENDMQKLGSAYTYARRYGFCAIVGLSQKDDDGNYAVTAPKTTAKPQVVVDHHALLSKALQETGFTMDQAKKIKQSLFGEKQFKSLNQNEVVTLVRRIRQEAKAFEGTRNVSQ